MALTVPGYHFHFTHACRRDTERREGSSTFRAAGRTESPLLATCRHEKLVTAVQTFDAGKTRFESPAIQVGIDDIVNEASPETVDPFETVFPNALHGFEMVLHEPV